jgi:hypothetical protein
MLHISLNSQQTRSKVMNCLDYLVELAVIQKDRVRRFWEKDRKSNAPFSNLSKAMNEYRRTLLDIQKLRFDLGLEEFKGVTRGARVTAPSVTRPDDSEIHQELLDAITTAKEIFRRRGIRVIPDVDLPDV